MLNRGVMEKLDWDLLGVNELECLAMDVVHDAVVRFEENGFEYNSPDVLNVRAELSEIINERATGFEVQDESRALELARLSSVSLDALDQYAQRIYSGVRTSAVHMCSVAVSMMALGILGIEPWWVAENRSAE
jgi:hypothetical protein